MTLRIHCVTNYVFVVSSNLLFLLPLPPKAVKLILTRKPRARTGRINAVVSFCIRVQCSDSIQSFQSPENTSPNPWPTSICSSRQSNHHSLRSTSRINVSSEITIRVVSQYEITGVSAQIRFKICRLQLHHYGVSRVSANFGALCVWTSKWEEIRGIDWITTHQECPYTLCRYSLATR